MINEHIEKETISVFKHTWQIIANPTAMANSGCKYWDKIIRQLRQLQLDYRFVISDDKDASQAIIKELCQKGNKHFLVIGGDGTINNVINAIFTAGVDTHDIYVGVLPLGTGNDWCHTHQYPRSYMDTINLFLRGQFVRHDIGIVDCFADNKTIATKYFINIAGFGFDANVIHHTINSKNHSSYIYITQLLKVLFSHQSQPISIRTDNVVTENNIFSIAVGICQYNGNGIRQVPMANPTDGLFNSLVVSKISPWKFIRNIKNLYQGRIEHLKEVSYLTSADLQIFSDMPILGEIEGEPLPITNHYHIKTLPQAINMLTGL